MHKHKSKYYLLILVIFSSVISHSQTDNQRGTFKVFKGDERYVGVDTAIDIVPHYFIKKDSSMNGHWIFYHDKELSIPWYETTYINGEKNGLTTEWFQDGSMKSQKLNLPPQNPYRIDYYGDGKIKNEYLSSHIHKTNTYSKWYENGNLSSLQSKDENGILMFGKEYYENGNPKRFYIRKDIPKSTSDMDKSTKPTEEEFFITHWDTLSNEISIERFRKLKLISLMGDQYANTSFDIIDFEKEKKKIFQFVKAFASQDDPVKIQKFIEFPFFSGRHTCEPYFGRRFILRLEKSDEQIKKDGLCKCSNPMYPLSNKYYHNKMFRDSLSKAGTNIRYLFFESQKNILDYCQWLINAYHFPRDYKINDINTVSYSLMEYLGQGMGSMIQISGWGFSLIQIVKINGNYKVSYVGYIWN